MNKMIEICSFNLLFFLFLIQFIHCQNSLSHCENGTRILISQQTKNLSFSCIDCPEGEFTYYDDKEKKLKCEKCPNGSSNNKNDIIINNFMDKDFSTKYSFSSVCSIQNDICPKWTPNYFSIKVKFMKSLSYKSSFTIKQYFMNDGELVIKYINYNGDIDKIFNIYINGKLSFTDNSNNNVLKIKYLEVKKGENNFIFEYLVNEELSHNIDNINENEAFLEIFEISMKNAEISALNCDKYDLIEKLSENILNNCEFDVSKCNSITDYCTYRFYSEVKNNYCIKQFDSFYQEIEYKIINNAQCMELSTPSNQNLLCEHCSLGQYSIFENSKKSCGYCEDGYYNTKEINDEISCDELCNDDNKEPVKIKYINIFDNPSNYKLEIEIEQVIGYITINYLKQNEKISTIFYIELDYNTRKLVDPNEEKSNGDYYSFSIPLVYGNHSLDIRGSNLKLNKIIIIGAKEGGNYKCHHKINLNEEKICEENDKYYSLLEEKCLNCSLGTIIDKNHNCEIYNQFINDKYTFDNKDINLNIFSNSYELENEDIKYYLNINPTKPLIYISKSDKIEIIGKELKNIKIVKGINERGIILSFISEKNKAFIYIKCNPNLSGDIQTQIILKNTVSTEEDINYFFILESNTSCPYCLSSEVNFEINDNAECLNGFKKAYVSIKNTSLCVIKSFNEKEKQKLKDDENILLNHESEDKEEQMILKYFEINEEIPINYEKENDEIIADYEKGIKCEKEDNNKKLVTAIIILLAFVILIILGLGSVVIWKIIDNKKKSNIEKKELTQNERMNELSVISSKD